MKFETVARHHLEDECLNTLGRDILDAYPSAAELIGSLRTLWLRQRRAEEIQEGLTELRQKKAVFDTDEGMTEANVSRATEEAVLQELYQAFQQARELTGHLSLAITDPNNTVAQLQREVDALKSQLMQRMGKGGNRKK